MTTTDYDPTAVARTHVLLRTNPKGEAFIGRCALCGAEGLPSGAVRDPCPNPGGRSPVDAIVCAVRGELP
jgi:hypothetical protein